MKHFYICPHRQDAHDNEIERNYHLNYIEVDSEVEAIRRLVEEQLLDNMTIDEIITKTKSDPELAKLSSSSA